jgi:hypothetical protein
LHKKKRLPTRSRFSMQNTEGVHRPPLSQKAPAPIACRVFFGQKPALYCQKTPLFYPNTEGVILPLFFDMKYQISSKFAFLMTKTTCNDI